MAYFTTLWLSPTHSNIHQAQTHIFNQPQRNVSVFLGVFDEIMTKYLAQTSPNMWSLWILWNIRHCIRCRLLAIFTCFVWFLHVSLKFDCVLLLFYVFWKVKLIVHLSDIFLIYVISQYYISYCDYCRYESGLFHVSSVLLASASYLDSITEYWG